MTLVLKLLPRSTVKGSLLPRSVLSGRVDARFPANLTATPPVLLTQTGLSYNISLDLNALLAMIPPPVIPLTRTLLTATKDYFVNPNPGQGNDANPGTSSLPFATINRAIAVLSTTVDVASQTVIIHCADGTYNEQVNVRNVVGYGSAGTIVIRGNIGTPSQCLINGQPSCISIIGVFSTWKIEGLRLNAPNGNCLNVDSSAVAFDHLDFGDCQFYVVSQNQSNVFYSGIGPCFISGDASQRGLLSQQQSEIIINSLEWRITGCRYIANFIATILGTAIARCPNNRFGKLVTFNSANEQVSWGTDVHDLTLPATTISTTNGSADATVASAVGLKAGMGVSSANVPANTVINSIAGTAVTLSQNATATASGTAATFYPPLQFHAYGNGDPAVSTLPTFSGGTFALDTIYFVKSIVDTHAVTLSSTPNGATLDFLTNGDPGIRAWSVTGQRWIITDVTDFIEAGGGSKYFPGSLDGLLTNPPNLNPPNYT